MSGLKSGAVALGRYRGTRVSRHIGPLRVIRWPLRETWHWLNRWMDPPIALYTHPIIMLAAFNQAIVS